MSNSAINFIYRLFKFAGRSKERVTRGNLTDHSFSNLDEQSVINSYLKKLNIDSGYCVDIAASDGITMSNTYALYKQGWKGLAVELDASQFSRLATSYVDFQGVNLSKCMVTPLNIVHLLQAHSAPVNFHFLSLDLDGYDYFVLEKILEVYRPNLICVEINEKIPPPIKFTVKWDKNYVWANDHFYGQSISQLNKLIMRHKYALVELHYNNAFLIPVELSPSPSVTPEKAYRLGYLEKPDRKQKFPWNENMEEVLNLEPHKALDFINNFFRKYEGLFEASI